MDRLLLATSNSGKAQELGELLAEEPWSLFTLKDLGLDTLEAPEESGLSFAENAWLKANHWHEVSSVPVLADDSGLVIPVLQGWPGLVSSRIAESDLKRRETVLSRLGAKGYWQALQNEGVKAYFECEMVLLFDGTQVRGQGRLHGRLKGLHSGQCGFGYDPIFYLGDGRSLADLKPFEKNSISHRSLALRNLLKKLA